MSAPTDQGGPMIVLARVFDTPDDVFTGGALRAEEVGLVVVDGTIAWRGPVGQARDAARSLTTASDGNGDGSGVRAVEAGTTEPELVDLRDGLLLPGLVDTHVHYPQVRAIGGLGMPLLDWLDRCALPEEARLADTGYAGQVAGEFLGGLAAAGTTTALVFGSHFAPAMEVLFTQAQASGLRITAGQVVSDRNLVPALHTDPETAYRQGSELIARWHGRGRLRYAVTPRFALSASDPMLAACRALLDSADDLWFTSHLNENGREVETVAGLFPGSAHYLDAYDRHGLVGPRSVLAHNVHPLDDELARMAATGAVAAHCATSNAMLGSGLFPLRRHLEAGVRVALGSDVGAGTGFSLLKEGLQAYFAQQLLGDQGYPLTAAHLLHLATASGAAALGLSDQVGDLGVGKQLDAVWLQPPDGSTLQTALRHAADDADALAKVFALGTTGDVARVWVAGHPVHDRDRRRRGLSAAVADAPVAAVP